MGKPRSGTVSYRAEDEVCRADLIRGSDGPSQPAETQDSF